MAVWQAPYVRSGARPQCLIAVRGDAVTDPACFSAYELTDTGLSLPRVRRAVAMYSLALNEST